MKLWTIPPPTHTPSTYAAAHKWGAGGEGEGLSWANVQLLYQLGWGGGTAAMAQLDGYTITGTAKRYDCVQLEILDGKGCFGTEQF